MFLLQLTTNQYRLPLTAVRPECQGVIRDREVPKNEIPPAPTMPYSKHTSPYFMRNSNPEKYIKLGE